MADFACGIFLPPGPQLRSMRKSHRFRKQRNLLLALGELKAGSQKSGKKKGAIIDILPSGGTVAGKGSWADDFASVWGEGKIPKPQPAYPMEEPAHIFGDRLQLPQCHEFSPAGGKSIKTGGGQAKILAPKMTEVSQFFNPSYQLRNIIFFFILGFGCLKIKYIPMPKSRFI